jgi:drug/metabolite transporter (DMT)-like permease
MPGSNNALNSPSKLGLWLALLATLCYSLKPIIIKLIYQYDVSSVDILAWRVIISLPIYVGVGVWVWYSHQQESASGLSDGKFTSKGWLIKTVILGIIGYYLAAILDLVGLQYISSQLARLILFTYPTLVAILGWLIFRHKVSSTVLIALVLSYIGVGLIFAFDLDKLGDQVIFGSIMMFLSVLSFSLYVLLSKSVIDQVGGAAFTVVAMLASGLCVLAHFAISGETFTVFSLSSPEFLLIAVMTLITTVIPSFLIAEAIALIGPQKTAIAGTFGPAATSIFAVLLLGETFAAPQLFGIVLVVAAISFMQREQNVK